MARCPTERVAELLVGPRRRGMLGHVDMQDAAAVMGEDDEDEEDPPRDGRDDKEVDRGQLAHVICEERAPRPVTADAAGAPDTARRWSRRPQFQACTARHGCAWDAGPPGASRATLPALQHSELMAEREDLRFQLHAGPEGRPERGVGASGLARRCSNQPKCRWAGSPWDCRR